MFIFFKLDYLKTLSMILLTKWNFTIIKNNPWKQHFIIDSKVIRKEITYFIWRRTINIIIYL